MSADRNLGYAICLLALVTKGSPDSEEAAQGTQTIDSDEDSPYDSVDDNLDDLDDPAMLSTDADPEENLTEMGNQFLDRLAEILARFKAKPGTKPKQNAKHVCATMMVRYETENYVKIFCAKNEGLDREDILFLEEWRSLMEDVSRKGDSLGEATSKMFNLVAKHQWPRIRSYLESLRQACRKETNSGPANRLKSGTLTAERVAAIPALRIRKWNDNNGFEFAIPLNSFLSADKETHMKSDTTCTGETLVEVQSRVPKIFQKIHYLCQPRLDLETEATLMKEIISHIFDLWREPRARFMLKAAMRSHFSRQKDRDILLFLGRISYATWTFIAIAKGDSSFQSIKIVPVPHRGNQDQHEQQQMRHAVRDESPSIPDVMKALGIACHPSWKLHLAQKDDNFTKLCEEKSNRYHHHAETQLLSNFQYSMSSDDRSQSHRYIGCSRRCCLLCYLFVYAHGRFAVRGTHGTLLHRWNVPMPSPTCSGSLFKELRLAQDRLFMTLKDRLRKICHDPPTKTKSEALRAQSSYALSSTGAIWEREPEYVNLSDKRFQSLAMMPTVFNNGLLIVPIHSKPGHASVSGNRFRNYSIEMTLTEAEQLKDQDIRCSFNLNVPEESSLKRVSHPHKCKLCGKSCELRCSACGRNYCDKKCQSKDWFRHVFVCCVKNRPNDLDHLKILTRGWLAVRKDTIPRNHFLTALFRDDHICCTFGFNQCVKEMEVDNLFCIYNGIMRRFSSKRLQYLLRQETLAQFIESQIQSQMKHTNAEDCGCFPWFLNLYRSGIFDIPNHDRVYLHQHWGIYERKRIFSIDPESTLSRSELHVRSLYNVLFRDFNNIPNTGDPEWIRFGFCYCKTREQKKLLAKAYIQLAAQTSLRQIATAWESNSLLELMSTKCIDTSPLASKRIHPGQPSPKAIGIYRLMSEVLHSLSGCSICQCINVVCPLHEKHESFLCKESEGNYGFHAVNTWERWQLLTFYAHLFSLPEFDPRKMQEARQHPNKQELDRYIESLVPNYRGEMINEHMTDAMFPKVNSGLEIHGEYHPCECFIHNVPISKGIDHFVTADIDRVCDKYKERDREHKILWK